jgi:hypothetical protein
MEDNERRSREKYSERTEAFYWEIEDSINRTENPESGRMNVELDELYVLNFSLSSRHTADSVKVSAEVQILRGAV